MTGINTPADALSYIYRVYGLGDDEYEVVESDGQVVVRVYRCPFSEYIEENASACSISLGIKKGLLEQALGKPVHLLDNGSRPLLLRTAHIPSGDRYCEFKLYLD